MNITKSYNQTGEKVLREERDVEGINQGLLEACKEMKNHIVRLTQDSESWEIIERAKQAIAKAEGRE